MVRLGLGVVVLLLAGSPALAAEDWKSDGPTCQGVYDALHKQKSSLMTLSAEARATPNFDKIDFDARASAPEVDKAVADYQSSDWEVYSQNFEMMLLKGSIDSDPKPILEVLRLAARCDTAFGLKPPLGPVPSMAAPVKPPPPKAPPPVAKAPPPPAAKAPVVDDKSCAVAYLALSYGNQGNPPLAGVFFQRADGALLRYAGTNPKLDRLAIGKEVQAAAETRVKAILIDKTAPAEPLFAEMRACDGRYGLPPPQ